MSESECPYTDDEVREMYREELASSMDIEAWEIFKQAEAEGKDPYEAVRKWYADETSDHDDV